jgi:hypothetical protein
VPNPKFHKVDTFNFLIDGGGVDAAECAIAAQTILFSGFTPMRALASHFPHRVRALFKRNHARYDQVFYVLACEIRSRYADLISILTTYRITILFYL